MDHIHWPGEREISFIPTYLPSLFIIHYGLIAVMATVSQHAVAPVAVVLISFACVLTLK